MRINNYPSNKIRRGLYRPVFAIVTVESFIVRLLTLAILVVPLSPTWGANRVGSRREPVTYRKKAVAGPKHSGEGIFVDPLPPPGPISATKIDSFPAHPSGQAEPGDTIDYTVDVNNSGGVDATGVSFADTIEGKTTLVPGSLKVSPLAFVDAYVATKDTPLNVSAPGVLTNDTGSPIPTAVPIASGSTTGGGTITLNANGSFNYTPASGFTGTDTFTYSATNGQAPPNASDAQATVTINVDAAPSVSTTTPTNGAVNQTTNTNITINFSEPINATTSSFTIECPAPGNTQTFAVSGSGTNTLTLDPTSDLPAGTTCTVTVIANQISDLDSNDPPDNMAANYVFSFTTDAAPSVLTTTPTNGASGVATNTNIVVNFSEPITATTSSFTIECPAAGNLKAFTVSGSGTSAITLDPTVDLPVGTTCTVTVIAGQIHDTDSNDPPDTMAANYVFSFTTDAPPSVSSTSPTDTATGVPTNSNIVVNFSEAVNATTSSFMIECPAPGNLQTFSVTGTGTSAITLDPAASLPAGTTCKVTVIAGQIHDSDANDPPDTMAADYIFNFTTDAAPSVSTITPANGATQQANNTNVAITFSEPVNVTGTWFQIVCGTSGTHDLSNSNVSGGPTTFTIDPTDFTNGETCTVTVFAAQVTDQDANDPPDNMAANFVSSFTIDQAPTVTTTTPINNATNIAQSSTVTINFSENVNVASGGVTINCGSALGFTPALPQNNVSSLVLTPTGGFPAGSNCTVTVDKMKISDTDTGDPPDNMVNDYVFAFKVKPDAVNDNVQTTTGQTVIGNVSFNSANVPYSVSSNDVSANSFTVTAFDAASANGGIVSVAATGQFTYNPPRGFEGADTFNYTISRDDGGGSDSAAVTINVSGMVWFINSAAGACSSNCDGRLSNPYTTLPNFQTANLLSGGLNPDNNDNIFLYTGTGNYSGSLTLRSGQRLIGQGATSSLASLAGLTVGSGNAALPNTGGTKPSITTAVTSGLNGLNLNANNQIYGVALNNTDGTAIVSTVNVGTFIIGDVAINNSGSPGAGIDLNDGGTSVTTTGTNTISTTTGTALNVTNTTIGASGLTFQSISAGTAASGPTNAIVLNNTGNVGGLSVTGTGTTVGSGGTIQKTVQGATFTSTSNLSLKNMNFTNANSGNGTCQNVDNSNFNSACQAAINMNTVTTATLDNLVMDGGVQVGINGRTVSNLSILNSTVKNFGDNVNENNLRFFNLTGTCAITNSNFSFATGDTTAGENLVDIRNDSGTLILNVLGSPLGTNFNNFSNTQDSATGAAGLSVTAVSSANATVNVQSSKFLNMRTAGIQTYARGSAVMSVNITGGGNTANGNTFDPSFPKLGRAIDLNAQDTAQLNFNINENPKIYGTGGPIINIFGTVNAQINGHIRNNPDIRNAGLSNSVGSAIYFHPEDSADGRVEIFNNTISGIGQDQAILLLNHGNGAALHDGVIDAIVANNTISLATAQANNSGIYINGGANAGDTNLVCGYVHNNAVTLGPPSDFGFVVFVDAPTSHVYLQNFSTNTVGTWNANANTPTNSALASAPTEPATSYPFNVSGQCRQPTNAVAMLTPTNQRDFFAQNNSGGSSLDGNVEGFAQSALQHSSHTTSTQQVTTDSIAALNGRLLRSIAGFVQSLDSLFVPAAHAEVKPERRNRDELAQISAIRNQDSATAGAAVRRPEVNKAGPQTKTASIRSHHVKPTRATVPVSGETVNYTIGTLPAGKHVRITFQVTVNNPFSGTQVSNQGSVSGTLSGNPFSVMTDDPSVGPNTGETDPTVTPVLGPADAVNDSYTSFKNTPLNVPAPGVLGNDTNSPTVSAIGGCADVTAPFSNCGTTAGGSVTVNADGSFSYTPPNATFVGPDSFTYTATNAAGSDTATVNITVADTSAIYINEVLFNPPGTDAPNEYIELRGTPSTTIPTGTYLVAIEGDAADNPGDVQTIINLSGLSLGSNGFLVLLQNGNTYTTAAGANVITSTTTGFSGLPGGIWSADGGATDIEDCSVTFMLIQSGVTPTLTDDIDANDDGVTDGSVFGGWNVRDSISAMNGSANARAYGAINFRNNSGSGTSTGTEVVVGFVPTYVGRIGNSTGSTASDWAGSGVLGGAASNWTLGASSETEPSGFAGKPLNHIGASNFTNLPPVNSVPGPQNVNEDTALMFNAANSNPISISDQDAGSADVKVTLTATNGTLSVSGTSGLSFTVGDGTSDSTMTFTGTVANINAALNGMAFTPAPNFFSPPNGTLQIITDDQGDSGVGGAQTDSDTVNITVNGVNDPPSFTIASNPPPVNEDAGAQTVNSFATSISQGAGESGQTLTFNITPAGTTGNISFSSSPAIDATTGNLTYTTNANKNGTATFNVTLSDNGSNVPPNSNTSAPQQFTITVNAVNDAPTLQILSNPPAVNEDAGGQTVNSFATNFQPGPATATDEIGQTLVGYTVTQTGTTGGLTFSSGPSISNSGTLTYTPTTNASGTATFNVVATDSGSDVAPNVNQSAPVSFTITVTNQNDAPVLDNSGNMTLTAINEDVPNASNSGTLVSAIIASAEPLDRITDVDTGALEGIAVIAVDDTNGTWQFSIDNGTNWTAFGSPSNTIARLLASNVNTRVRFLPNANFNGTVNTGLTFRAWDQTSGTNGNTADPSTNGGTTAFSTATETASITVNPVNDQPTADAQIVGANEDIPVGIVLTGSDVETAAGNLSFNITVLPAHGVLSGSGANRTYTPSPDYNGPDSFSFTVTDTGDGVSPPLTSAAATVTINIAAVNDAPVANAQSVSTNEDTAKPITLTGSDIDTAAGSLSYIIVSGPSHGTLNPGTSANRTYTPTGNYNGPDSFTFKINDGSADSNTATVTITVDPVNDQPTANAQSPSTNEDTLLSITLSASDVETAASNLTFDVTVQPTHGVLSGTGANRTYTPDLNYNGPDSFKFTVTDTGDGASPALSSAEATMTITVNAVNDAPVNTVPASQMVAQNGSLTFSAANGNSVSVADLDAGTNPVRVQLTGTNGTMTLSGIAGLSFTVGDGTADPTMTFTGTITNINAALNGLAFTPTSGFNGAASLQIFTNDQGNTGSGGAQSDTDTVNINVTPAALVSFSTATYTVNENSGSLAVNVNRTGDTSVAVTVDYATSDNSGPGSGPCVNGTGQASSRCDYNSVFGTLRFAAGETQKTIMVPIIWDAFTEGPETFTITLSNLTGSGSQMVVPSNATVTTNDSSSPPTPNAIDDTEIFVRQQYHDFLNREADAAGLAFWKDNIDKCNDPARRPAGLTVAQCIETLRIHTSAAFFLSIEFRQTGGLVRDFYVAALNRPATNNMPNFVEFMRDTQAVQRGVIVGQGNWQNVLDNNRMAFMNDFVMRSEFVGLYPTTDTPAQYVDKLFLHANVAPTTQERADAINEFGGAATADEPGARGRALLHITQHPTFRTREMNRAFVQMEYLGYLRRNPNDPPDNDFSGYNFWLNKLIQFNGDFIAAEMVKAFLSSAEYRRRFGP